MYLQSKSDLEEGTSTRPKGKISGNLDDTMDTDQLPSPSPPDEPKATTSKKSSQKKEKNPNPSGIEKDILESMNKTITSIHDYVDTKKSQKKSPLKTVPTSDDDTDMWTQLLGKKVRRMDQMAAEEFKLKVDTLALEYLSK